MNEGKNFLINKFGHQQQPQGQFYEQVGSQQNKSQQGEVQYTAQYQQFPAETQYASQQTPGGRYEQVTQTQQVPQGESLFQKVETFVENQLLRQQTQQQQDQGGMMGQLGGLIDKFTHQHSQAQGLQQQPSAQGQFQQQGGLLSKVESLIENQLSHQRNQQTQQQQGQGGMMGQFGGLSSQFTHQQSEGFQQPQGYIQQPHQPQHSNFLENKPAHGSPQVQQQQQPPPLNSSQVNPTQQHLSQQKYQYKNPSAQQPLRSRPLQQETEQKDQY